MEPLVHAMLSNALAALVLAVFVAILGRAWRRPALIHGLWLVVMLKLVTPPVVPVSLPVGMSALFTGWSENGGEDWADGGVSSMPESTDPVTTENTTAELCDFDEACDEDSNILGIDSPIDATALRRFDSPLENPALGLICASIFRRAGPGSIWC